jgi:hypothetical protein
VGKIVFGAQRYHPSGSRTDSSTAVIFMRGPAAMLQEIRATLLTPPTGPGGVALRGAYPV